RMGMAGPFGFLAKLVGKEEYQCQHDGAHDKDYAVGSRESARILNVAYATRSRGYRLAHGGRSGHPVADDARPTGGPRIGMASRARPSSGGGMGSGLPRRPNAGRPLAGRAMDRYDLDVDAAGRLRLQLHLRTGGQRRKTNAGSSGSAG